MDLDSCSEGLRSSCVDLLHFLSFASPALLLSDLCHSFPDSEFEGYLCIKVNSPNAAMRAHLSVSLWGWGREEEEWLVLAAVLRTDCKGKKFTTGCTREALNEAVVKDERCSPATAPSVTSSLQRPPLLRSDLWISLLNAWDVRRWRVETSLRVFEISHFFFFPGVLVVFGWPAPVCGAELKSEPQSWSQLVYTPVSPSSSGLWENRPPSGNRHTHPHTSTQIPWPEEPGRRRLWRVRVPGANEVLLVPLSGRNFLSLDELLGHSVHLRQQKKLTTGDRLERPRRWGTWEEDQETEAGTTRFGRAAREGSGGAQPALRHGAPASFLPPSRAPILGGMLLFKETLLNYFLLIVTFPSLSSPSCSQKGNKPAESHTAGNGGRAGPSPTGKRTPTLARRRTPRAAPSHSHPPQKQRPDYRGQANSQITVSARAALVHKVLFLYGKRENFQIGVVWLTSVCVAQRQTASARGFPSRLAKATGNGARRGGLIHGLGC
ncbi:uncharacterized protein [Equus caballus]|uniref:uncharacterized protein n=1 Tax=Equus caballus TaxID=9796 RepID=UPI0038B3B3AE